MIHFEPVAVPPASLRQCYLDTLAEPQELYLEQRVSRGATWCLADCAYAVVLDEMLVEFFVVPEATPRLVEIFDAAMGTTGASEVLCKSFDTQLLFAALSREARVTSRGLLFRRIEDRTFMDRDGVAFRRGTVSDATRVLEFNDDFFVDVQEIKDYAAIEGLFLLHQGHKIVGCGIGKPVIAGRPDIDIGMLVAPEYRRRGYGAHIISFLKSHYLGKRLRPICGCSIDNIGSHCALRNAGFVGEHRLLQISY